MRRMICLERPAVFRQIPVVDVHAVDHRAAGFQAGDQAAVRDAVFLQADDQIRHRQPLVERGEQFAPGVRLGHDDRGRDAEFLEHGQRLGAADDGFDVAHGREKPLAIDVPLDLCDQMPRADAGEKDDDVDLAGDEPIGEVDGRLIVRERHFAHRRADERHAAPLGDHALHVVGAATFEGGDAETGKIGGIGAHRDELSVRVIPPNSLVQIRSLLAVLLHATSPRWWKEVAACEPERGADVDSRAEDGTQRGTNASTNASPVFLETLFLKKSCLTRRRSRGQWRAVGNRRTTILDCRSSDVSAVCGDMLVRDARRRAKRRDRNDRTGPISQGECGRSRSGKVCLRLLAVSSSAPGRHRICAVRLLDQ